MRPSWIEVDLEAVRHNVSTLTDLVAPSQMCAVVKADGYGHGDVPVATAAIESGATWLAVALVEEGVRLREAGITAPILLLSEPPNADAPDVIEWNLTPTVYTAGFCDALAGATTEPIAVHLKVDTGMHRVGTSPQDALALARHVDAKPGLDLAAVWTHLAVAEEDAEYTMRQVASIRGFMAAAGGEGLDIPMLHIANTAGAMGSSEARADMVRCGIGIYGLHPAPGFHPEIPLRPAMRVVSQVSLVRRLRAGTRASYGRRREMPADGWVATVPVGYADGVARRLGDVGGEVLIGGKRRPLAGTVTMDQIVVDCGDDPVEIGDEVVLIGRQGDEEITADDWARWLGTINYEIVCDFGPRMPRRFQG
ncbi:MAG: alanine racemase [Acidimicrobiia bacterium]|nr:alanine racemase [Acidimicrobiia bacterium]